MKETAKPMPLVHEQPGVMVTSPDGPIAPGHWRDSVPPPGSVVTTSTGLPEKGRRKRKGQRKPRTMARLIVYVERLFAAYPLDERQAGYAMLKTVTRPTLGEEKP